MDEADVEMWLGRRHGRLTHVEFFCDPKVSVHWVCKCDCGNEIALAVWQLGRIRSCGCHTHKGGRLTRIWVGMMQRCHNPKATGYKNYGRRGIAVCKEWFWDSKKFYDWAMKRGYKHGLQIDRRDNYKGYEPSNCRFVTIKEQQKNKRVHQDARGGTPA